MDDTKTALAVFEPANRDGAGRFRHGNRANPSGRPRKDPIVEAILKAASPNAARRLVRLTRCGDPQVALRACVEVLNRTEGKPVERVETSRADDPRMAELEGLTTAELMERAKAVGVRESAH